MADAWKDVPLTANLFHGAVDLDTAGTDGGITPWRIRLRDKELYYDAPGDNGLLKQARCPSGVRLVLRFGGIEITFGVSQSSTHKRMVIEQTDRAGHVLFNVVSKSFQMHNRKVRPDQTLGLRR